MDNIWWNEWYNKKKNNDNNGFVYSAGLTLAQLAYAIVDLTSNNLIYILVLVCLLHYYH